MATTFREDANTTARVESTEYGLVNSCLVHVRRKLELRALEVFQVLVGYIPGEFSIARDVFSSGKLVESVLVFEDFLDDEFLWAVNFSNGRIVRLARFRYLWPAFR